MITEFDKRVYNMWLASTRSYHKKPFRLRKDFSKVTEDDPLYVHIKQLAALFRESPHLMRPEYFHAPFEMLKSNRKHYDIGFYATYQAVSVWVAYVEKMEQRDPDSQIKAIKESFSFIYRFCKDMGITLEDYPFYREKQVAQYSFLKHIKNHQVTPYVVFEIRGMYDNLINLDEDIYELYYGDMKMVDIQRRYNNAKTAPQVAKKCREIVSEKLQNR